jgi:hypothetical protein
MLTYTMLALSLLALRHAPAGTQLHIRLTAPVGTYASAVGEPIRAILIAPVAAAAGEILLPAGSSIEGTVKRVTRVGFGLIHETATLDLEFNDIRLPDGEQVPIASRVLEVDNGRERVVANGSIRGERTTSTVAYRASGYIRTALCWEIHARLAFWAVKTLLIRVPEPELYYAPGVEMTLSLTEPLVVTPQEPAKKLTSAELEQVRLLVSQMPYRTTSKASVPSDLVNMMFVGTRGQIAEAFKASGWTEASPRTMRSRIRNVRAFVEGLGDRAAPMSMLLLNEAQPDMSWQKSFNDVSKRHHARVWKQAETWDGQEIWAAAATRDIDYAYMRPGSAWTHRVEQDIDRERDKVAYDFQFTSCTDLVDWWDRPGAPLEARNASGDPMSTDGRIAIVRLNDCAAPRLILNEETAALKVHGNYLQRLARRQILSIRSDFYRTNMYWRSYEGLRWAVTAAVRHHHHLADTARGDDQPATTLAGSFRSRAWNSSWLR